MVEMSNHLNVLCGNVYAVVLNVVYCISFRVTQSMSRLTKEGVERKAKRLDLGLCLTSAPLQR